MAAYYNDFSPHNCAALRELMAVGLIAPGEVDERSIAEVQPDDLRGFDQCHFFAGIGIWSHALRCAGWGDERGVWSGSVPCQPFSNAGKGDEFADERHLWPAWFSLIRQCRPNTVFGEQVSSRHSRIWIDLVRHQLEGAGYAIGVLDTNAAGVGAQFIGQRLYYVASAERDKQPREEPCLGSLERVGRVEQSLPWDTAWESALARFRAMGDGNPRCVAATDAIRNALCAPQAEAFVRAYMETRR